MKHEIIPESNEIPSGYDTYSILLIPEMEALNLGNTDNIYKLFLRFKAFGESIGEKHLAAWFYHAGPGPYAFLEDREIFSAVYGLVESKENLVKFVSYETRMAEQWMQNNKITYDIIRSRHFCARCGLDLNKGPYIAFFEEYPNVPYLQVMGKRFEPSSNSLTKPSFVIQFDGMTYKEIIETLNQLENELLKDIPNIKKLRREQLVLRSEQLCHKAAIKVGKAAKIIKDLGEILPLSLVKNLI